MHPTDTDRMLAELALAEEALEDLTWGPMGPAALAIEADYRAHIANAIGWASR